MLSGRTSLKYVPHMPTRRCRRRPFSVVVETDNIDDATGDNVDIRRSDDYIAIALHCDYNIV